MSALAGLLRRPLKEVQDFAAAWTKFWFEPQDVATVAFLRLLAGGMILYTHIIWSLRLESFFSSDGWQPALVVDNLREGAMFWSFWWYVPNEMLWPVHIVCLVVLTMFFIGLWTPVTSKLTFVIVVSYAHRVPLANYGLDQINGFLALYLALSPCGRVGSVDWLLRRRRLAKRQLLHGQVPELPAAAPSSRARLAMRLIQIQLCVLYTYAGIAKLKGSAWWEGDAIWMAAANLEYQSNSLVWLAWMAPVAQLLTHATILWECTFWAAVWPQRTRPYVLFIGGMMHLGIGAFMGMWTFGLVMTFAYQAFAPPETIRKLAGRFWSSLVKPRTVSFVPAEAGRLSWLAAIDGQNVVRFERDHASFGESGGSDDRTQRVAPAAQLPTTWSEAVRANPVPQAGNHVLYVDADPESQLAALTNFSKYKLQTRAAADWETARLLRVAGPVDVLVLNLAFAASEDFAAIEQDLAEDGEVSAVVLVARSNESSWVRSGDFVLEAPASLRSVRTHVERLLAQRMTDQALDEVVAGESLTDTDSELEVTASTDTTQTAIADAADANDPQSANPLPPGQPQ